MLKQAINQTSLNSDPVYDTMDAIDRPLSVADCRFIEMQIVAFLNALRKMQGKRPVILPGDKRTHD